MLLRPHFKNYLPYKPGKPIDEVKRELGLKEVIKLASNENPFGISPLASKAIKNSIAKINLYPDGSCFYLKKALAKKLKIKEENLIFGNGSDEIIELIALAYLNPGEEVITSECAFIRYKMAVDLIPGKNVIVPMKDYTHDLKAMAERITPSTKLIYIANPNNPTGTMVTGSEVNEFMKKVSDNIIVVFDEAYYEFITRKDYPQTVDLLREGKNIIILRTFSKIYGLAGLRIGYGIGQPEIIQNLNNIRCPFNVNSIAQIAAIASLEDKNFLKKIRKNNVEWKKYLYREFKKMNLSFVLSEANFVLVNIKINAREIFNKLLKEGVIVRPMAEYNMPTFIRVTIGKPEENRKFIATLKKIL